MADPINIDSADAVELELIPGIGQKRASLIAAYRDEYGHVLLKTLVSLTKIPVAQWKKIR